MRKRLWILVVALLVATLGCSGFFEPIIIEVEKTVVVEKTVEVEVEKIVEVVKTVEVEVEVVKTVVVERTVVVEKTIEIEVPVTLTVEVEVMVTPSPTATPSPFPTATVQAAVVPTAAETASVGVLTGTIPGGAWTVSGPLVPTQTTVIKVGTVGINDVRQVVNGLENFGVDPGVLTTEDCQAADASVSALCSLRSNVQWTIPFSGTAFVRVPEADLIEGSGYVMVTGGYFNLQLQNGTSISLISDEDVSWIALVRGPENADGTTPLDGNWQLAVSDYNAGFCMATVLPPGQFVSAEYLTQNAQAAATTECGNDGCPGVGVIAYDTNDQSVTVTYYSSGDWFFQFRNWEMPMP